MIPVGSGVAGFTIGVLVAEFGLRKDIEALSEDSNLRKLFES